MRQQEHTGYRGHRTAGIRLTQELRRDLLSKGDESDGRSLEAVHAFDKAHLVMLVEEGLIPPEDGCAMLVALRDMEGQGAANVRREVGGAAHSGERYLIRRLGEGIGGRIPLGRSSGDLGAVSKRIIQRDAAVRLMERINRLRVALVAVAEQHVETIMPCYAHNGTAQPTSFGHQMLAWVAVLERDFRRFADFFERTNQSPAGAAIQTGSDFPLNRQRTSELLGFSRPLKNTMDAISSHDDHIEMHACVTILHSTLSRWAEDLMLWSSDESGMIDFPDEFCGTSSIMMQKKNPYFANDMKGAAAEAAGGLMTALVAYKDSTQRPIREKRYTIEALMRSIATAERGLEWLTSLMPLVSLRYDVMEDHAGAWWAQATDVGGALVRENGLPVRTAHQIVGILVRLSVERGIPPREVTTQLLDEAAVEYFDRPVGLPQEVLDRALDPRHFVETRNLYGGPGPEEVLRRLPEYTSPLASDQRWLKKVKASLDAAPAQLEAAIDDLLHQHAKPEPSSLGA